MTAIKVHHTDTSDAAWDGPAAKANLKTGADEAYYRGAFAWQDPEGDATTKAAYKFIHHEVSSDGTIGAANLKGCSAGIGVLNGGMTGTNIPDGDRQGVYDHLAAHLKDGNQKPPELNAQQVPEVERRYLNMELRASKRADTQQPVIEGVAAVYDQETTVWFWRESLRAGAFTRVLSEKPDVVGAFNHDWNQVLGRTTADTLHLTDAEDGLHYSIDINLEDPMAMSVFAKVQRGDVHQSSFAFDVRKDEWTYPTNESDPPLRTITEIGTLYDVSPVTFPAYPTTSATVRSQAQAFLQKQPTRISQAAPEGAEAGDLGLALRQKARRRRLDLEDIS